MPAASSPQLKFATQEAWRQWLDAQHASEAGVWLQIAKQASGVPTVTYAQALEVALCYGWIDGMKKGLDETWFLQKFTPRKPQSIWSQVNRDKVLDLIDRGLMQPAGQAAIEQARRNGRWDAAYAPQSKATVPADLQAALDTNPKAAAFFATLKGSNRYAFIFWLQTAKKAETRAARIQKFLAMLERGETFY